ncbi:hypothetical protein SLS56_011613 [Neofusicoccum ribis]|uniref:Uncharacterized protein n=1 Tax=Neofusicoccum ribis TaxID=45134 RepID=A0ABR3SC48_9PEZI
MERGLSEGMQGPLPDNQWQLDVENWFAISLAALQGWMVELATGPSDSKFLDWIDSPTSEGGRYWCKNQKILTTAYTNFNTFGLCLTLILGTIIITVSYSLEPLVSWIQKRRRLDTYSRLEWCTNETLQLQRLAHEELGLGTWSGAAGNIPFTEPGEMLAMLDLSRPHHPRLKAPPANFEDLLATGTSGKQVPDHELSNASDTSSNSEGKSQ